MPKIPKIPNVPLGNFVAGEWVDGSKAFSINPATAQPFCEYVEGNEKVVDQAVQAARSALSKWMETSPLERGRLLSRWSGLVLESEEELAIIEMVDSGKPISFARSCVRTAARYLEYYAGLCDKIQGDTIPFGHDYLDFTQRIPLGVTAHILPWNVPLGMMMRSVVPALASGCTAVVKPAEQTPLGALQLAKLSQEAGIPPGVVNVVNGGPETGASLSKHFDIDGITFTGSVSTGRKIAASAAENVIPITLELGGKSPIIACLGSNLEYVAGEVTKGIFSNSGQYCDASSRLLVHRDEKSEIIDRMVSSIKRISVDMPEKDPVMGPLISEEQKDQVLKFIGEGKSTNELIGGGNSVEKLEPGYFVEPTIFSNVKKGDVIAQKEIFGPVLSIMEYESLEEAIDIANSTEYGLSAGIFSPDIHTALSLNQKIMAGTVYINEYYCGDVSLPFGGFKKSGFGRECGLEAINNYTQTKNTIIKISK